MDNDERSPIGDVLSGFMMHRLDAGWTPLQAFVLVKSFDEEETPPGRSEPRKR